MITIDDYFGPYAKHPDAKPGKWAVADIMLDKVNGLLEEAMEHGVDFIDNPKTGTLVSGSENGGFRPMDCKTGAPLSAHKGGHAVDVFDPRNELDNWLTDEILTKHKLYREHPDDSPTWCHLQDTPPKSGKRTFKP